MKLFPLFPGNVEIVSHRGSLPEDLKEHHELVDDNIAKSAIDSEPLSDNSVTDISATAGVDSFASLLPQVSYEQTENVIEILRKPKLADIQIESLQAELIGTETHDKKSIADDFETVDRSMMSSEKLNKEETITLKQDVSGCVAIVLPLSSFAQKTIQAHPEFVGDSIAKSNVDNKAPSEVNVSDIDYITLHTYITNAIARYDSADLIIAHHKDSVTDSQTHSFTELYSEKIIVQDAGMPKTTIGSIPDKIPLEEQTVPDFTSTDSFSHVTPDSTVSESMEKNYSSRDSGLSEKVFESIPSNAEEHDSQMESGKIENETQIVEKPKTIDTPIGSPQAEVTETETQPGIMLLKDIQESLSPIIMWKLLRNLCQVLTNQIKKKLSPWTRMFREVLTIILPRSSQAQNDAEEHHKLIEDSIAKPGVDMEAMPDNHVSDEGGVAGVDSGASLLTSVSDVSSTHHEDSMKVSKMDQILTKRTTVQDAGISEKTVTSIPDEKLALEVPMVTDLKRTDILHPDIQVPLPTEAVDTIDPTITDVTQDAGVKEYVVVSIPDVISEAEEPSSSTLDSSVAHKEILIQSFPGISKIDSAAAADEESQIKQTTVQDAGISEKTIASIPDEELLLEEPLVTDLKSTEILHHDVQVPLPIGTISTDDGT